MQWQLVCTCQAYTTRLPHAFTPNALAHDLTPTTRPHFPLQVAGSAAAFKKVDFDYVAATARLAKSCGVRHFSLVSATGANAK